MAVCHLIAHGFLCTFKWEDMFIILNILQYIFLSSCSAWSCSWGGNVANEFNPCIMGSTSVELWAVSVELCAALAHVTLWAWICDSNRRLRLLILILKQIKQTFHVGVQSLVIAALSRKYQTLYTAHRVAAVHPVDCKEQSLILISHSLWENLSVLGYDCFNFKPCSPLAVQKKQKENVLTSLTLCRVTVEQTQMTRECSRLSKVNRTWPILFPYCGRFQFDTWNKWERKLRVSLFLCLLYN